MTTSRLTLAIALGIALGGCRREPQCHGRPSNDEIGRMRNLASRGEDPCREHHDPIVTLGVNGLSLNGRVLAAADELPRDFIRPIGALFTELEQNRETWQRVRPGTSFDGRAILEISPKTSFIAGASAITTAARAGYLRNRIESGDVAFDATCDVPGAAKPSTEVQWDLHIEEKPEGRYTLTLKAGRVVVNSLDVAAIDGVARDVENMCSASRCDVLIPRLRGEFQPAARLVGRLLELRSLSQRPTRVRFEYEG